MKCYVSERNLRLVGKGWEIREFLRRRLQEEKLEASLAVFLADRTRGYRMKPERSLRVL
jgi:hypothetical protein